MNPGEIEGYNRGVADIVHVAAIPAFPIKATTKRPIAEGFAICVLEELAAAGAALILPHPAVPQKGPEP